MVMEFDRDSSRFDGWLWPLLLVASASAGSLALACVAPFAAFAVIAVASLEGRRAYAVMAAVWAANQAMGFGFLGYPWTLDCVLWGLAIGVAAMAGTWAAAATMDRLSGLAAWLAAAVAAFAAYEAALFLVALASGGVEEFTVAIVFPIAVTNACWLAALVAAREAGLFAARFPIHRGAATAPGIRPAG